MTKATKEGHKEEKYCFFKIMNFLCKITYVRVYIACFHLCNVGRMTSFQKIYGLHGLDHQIIEYS